MAAKLLLLAAVLVTSSRAVNPEKGAALLAVASGGFVRKPDAQHTSVEEAEIVEKDQATGEKTVAALKAAVETVATPMYILVPVWSLGVLICIMGTSLTSLGLVLQKHSQSQNAKLIGEKVVYYMQEYWLLGFAIFLAGQIINVAAMSLAPQAMTSCLGAFALIFNAFFAWAIHGERLLFLEICAMVGIVVGALVVIHSTPVSDKLALDAVGIDEIVGPLFRPFFLFLSAAITLSLLSFRFLIEHCSPDLAPLFWSLASATLSGYTVTFFRCISFLFLTMERTHPLSYWRCHTVALVACLLCMTQLYVVNTAIQSGRAVSVVPAIFAFSLLAQIGVGEAAYQEMHGITGVKAVLFASGIALILACVVAMVRMKIAEPESAELESEDGASVPLENGGMTPSTPFAEAGEFSHSSSWPKSTKSDRLTVGFVDFGFTRSERLFTRAEGELTLDFETFTPHAHGKKRTYTLSLAGPMGLA